MGIFDVIRENVTARQAAEYYGVHVNHNGMACCPFHNDRHPSLKLDKRFHCFGCQEDGDAVDFVAKMFGLRTIDAAIKIAEDFNLAVDFPKKESAKERNARIRLAKAKEHENKVRRAYAEELRLFRLKLSEFFQTFHYWNLEYAPTEDEWNAGTIDERYIVAAKFIDQVDYILEVIDFGNDDDIFEIYKNREEIISKYEREITNAQQRAAR